MVIGGFQGGVASPEAGQMEGFPEEGTWELGLEG